MYIHFEIWTTYNTYIIAVNNLLTIKDQSPTAKPSRESVFVLIKIIFKTTIAEYGMLSSKEDAPSTSQTIKSVSNNPQKGIQTFKHCHQSPTTKGYQKPDGLYRNHPPSKHQNEATTGLFPYELEKLENTWRKLLKFMSSSTTK